MSGMKYSAVGFRCQPRKEYNKAVFEMKKILFTITTLFGGGAERVVSVWASELAELGYPVSLLIYGRSENEYPVSDKVKICTVAKSYAEYKSLNYIERLKRMHRIIKEEKADVTLNFLPRMQIWVMLASIGLKTYSIETVRISPWEVCKNSKMERKLWVHCFKKADAVIVQTPEQATYFSKKIQDKCIVIPNPISKEYEVKFKSVYPQNNTKFLASGRLTDQKNYPMMFKAFSEAHADFPNITLSIYGTGDDAYIEKLKALIIDLNAEDYIRLEGRTSRMADELVCRDAYIMASDYEGMPNALAEAMAAGLVCVSTNCKTGPSDLIDDGGNGFLVDVGDHVQMASKIKTIAGFDQGASEKMGKAAREKIMNFCNETNSRNRLIDLIENGVK